MRKTLPIIVGLCLVLFVLYVQISPTPFLHDLFSRVQDLDYDIGLRTQVLTKKYPPVNNIAIVDIDDKSLQAQGHWPWSREKLARLTDEITRLGAVITAYDIIFPEAEPNMAEIVISKLKQEKKITANIETLLQQMAPNFADDALFAHSLTSGQNILPIAFLANSLTLNTLPASDLVLNEAEKKLKVIAARGYVANIPLLQDAAKHIGFNNISTDLDGIIRRTPLLISYRDNIYSALSLKAVSLYLGEEAKLIVQHYHDREELEGVSLGKRMIPTDAQGRILIPFIGPGYTFPYYSATDLLNHKLPDDALLGKIIFVGTSAVGMNDLKATSMGSQFPGVEIHATIARGILENYYYFRPAWVEGANIFITLAAGLLATFIFPLLGARLAALFLLLLPGALILVNTYLWKTTGIVLSPLIGFGLIFIIGIFNIIYGYFFESSHREKIRAMFGHYVPEDHIKEMLQTSANYGLHGEEREMSVLFADIRNFTAFSEKLRPDRIVEILNQVFSPMTEVILNHGGTIDKYVGDLIMAFWGAPLIDEQHAEHAVLAALNMKKKLKLLQPQFRKYNIGHIKMGIGINTGKMIVGDMGSNFRLNYTVIGDSVNLASRVEGLSKVYGTDIIVTEYTMEKNPHVLFKMIDRVHVKGKEIPVNLFQALCLKTEADKALEDEIALHQQAMEYYFAQAWKKAEELFVKLHEMHPKSKLYEIFIERIKKLKTIELPKNWNGIFDLHKH